MLTPFILAGLFVIARKPTQPAPTKEEPPFVDDAEPIQRMESRRYLIKLASGDRTEETFLALFASQGVNGRFIDGSYDGMVLIELSDVNVAAAFGRLLASPQVKGWAPGPGPETFAGGDPQSASANLIPSSLPFLTMPGTTLGG